RNIPFCLCYCGISHSVQRSFPTDALPISMMVYILVSGETAFLLNALTENIGRFLMTLPARTLQTFVYEPGGSEWMGGWTLFFWRSEEHTSELQSRVNLVYRLLLDKKERCR